MIDKSLLLRIFGYRALFMHGDPLMLDRWRWAKRRIPKTRNGENLFDAGCGTGAFTIGTAKRGYQATGLSWDKRNQNFATDRAKVSQASNVEFPIGDVRELDSYEQHFFKYHIVMSFENIEHVLNDKKLVVDLARCLKPGGWLLLTTPNYYYKAISKDDDGPFPAVENGWHVRRGYTEQMLVELVESAGLMIEEVSSCSGFFSQKITKLMRGSGLMGWALTFPLRILPLLFDNLVRKLTGYPDFSICMVAYKPRY